MRRRSASAARRPPFVNPATKERRRIGEDEAGKFIAWLSEQELDGRIVALWLGLTEHEEAGPKNKRYIPGWA